MLSIASMVEHTFGVMSAHNSTGQTVDRRLSCHITTHSQSRYANSMSTQLNMLMIDYQPSHATLMDRVTLIYLTRGLPDDATCTNQTRSLTSITTEVYIVNRRGSIEQVDCRMIEYDTPRLLCTLPIDMG